MKNPLETEILGRGEGGRKALFEKPEGKRAQLLPGGLKTEWGKPPSRGQNEELSSLWDLGLLPMLFSLEFHPAAKCGYGAVKGSHVYIIWLWTCSQIILDHEGLTSRNKIHSLARTEPCLVGQTSRQPTAVLISPLGGHISRNICHLVSSGLCCKQYCISSGPHL